MGLLPAGTKVNANGERIVLCPERDVEVRDGYFLATSSEPWLQIEPHPNLQPGAFFEIILSGQSLGRSGAAYFSILDERWRDHRPARSWPRCGRWYLGCRIPDRAVRASVSPANRLGPFNFEIELIRLCSPWSLLAKGWRQEPQLARNVLFTKMIGWEPESEVNLSWATAFTPLNFYKDWRDLRARTVDLARIDAPRCDWSKGAEIIIIVKADGAVLTGLTQTWNSLRAQHYRRWLLLIVTEEGSISLPQDQRIR